MIRNLIEIKRHLAMHCVSYDCVHTLHPIIINIRTDNAAAIQRDVALWILKTREVHTIPLSVMDNIAADAQSLFELVMGQINNHLCACLEKAESVTEAKDCINKELSEAGSLFNILHGLETQSKQLSYFQKHFNFIVSFGSLCNYSWAH